MCVGLRTWRNPISYQTNNRRKSQSSNKRGISITNSNDWLYPHRGGRNKLCGLLQRNLDIFAWKPADMTGVPRHIAEHRLNVQEGCSPDGGWRMCIDFKDLNKTCPKDGYPLPEIDWKVESLCGFPFKCFLDAYKGYHQIQMAMEDEEKIAFITSQGIFCYTKMPFGLRNVGATYQRLVDKVFHKQIGINLEVYMDDIVIKSHTEDEIVRDVEETFRTLKEINMKLNPKKCAFGVKEEMFVGYKVNAKGLKVCTDKVDDVLSLSSPNSLKDVQKLKGKLISLNRALRGPELNYTSMEKLVLALVHASKCLKRPRVSVKRQILADFVLKRIEEDSLDTPMEEEGELPEPWILFTDGSSCTVGYEAGLILTNPEGMEFTYVLRFRFDATNNEAEYEALIARLWIAEQMGVKNLQANVKALTGSFRAFSIKQIPESENKKVDALSEIASTSFAHLSKQVLVEELKEKSIGEIEILTVVEEEGDTWMTPFFKYLAEGTLPADANYVLREIHEGSCSMHTGTRSVVAKALRTGYDWPTMHKDVRTLIRACQDCQVYKPVPRNPQQKLTSITSPWPFYKWGIDIVGPFSKGPGKVKFLIVAMDYFTKWIEAKPIATITGNQIKKFVWDNIVCRFGIPGEIISDNGKQFRDDPFKYWCEKLSRLDARSKNWIEELPHVLWARRTMIKSSNGDTPFSLTYETEAVIPAEIGMPTLRTAEVDLVGNNEALEINLDLLEEIKEEEAIREAKSKAKMEKYYNSKV
uniref:Reverse transcriptase domain-containing protein n=1 Tax=Tanacetum cinerariifolium TaxID=118510 RepID=A0A6L2L9R4_TANCI|nr:reverse transcriptase domain-containing protein [Tanacetum cinerariifolium]